MADLAPLRPHQIQTMAELRSALRDGARRPMVQLPTGAGKTVLAAHIIAGAREKSKRVAFCVPSLSLVDQTFQRFIENCLPAVEMGVLQGNHPWRRAHAPIQIATAQTLARRDLPPVDVAIIDEAHVRFGVYDRWIKDCPEVLFIGLSATPGSRGLGKIFDRLIQPISLAELIEQKFLSPFRVFAPSHPDLSACQMIAGDYHEGDLGEIMGKPTLVADIVETWLVRGVGRPTLCFAVNRRHARLIHDQFAEVGVRVAYVDADTPREERFAIGKRLASGEVQVVCNIGTLTTGIDWDVRCLILARPTRSEMLFVQIIGRGLRTAAGKDHCLILDHSDTHQKLGMVTDISFNVLDDGKKKKKKSDKKDSEKTQPLPKCCPACSSLMPITQAHCAGCGYVMPLIDPVSQIDGDLVELGKGGKKQKQESVIDRLRAMGKPDVHGQLVALREQRGYSDKWVAWKYKTIFEVWPRGETERREPSSELLAFVRSEARAYAKAQDAAKKAAEATNAAAA
jgi:DNA repair protein RadD